MIQFVKNVKVLPIILFTLVSFTCFYLQYLLLPKLISFFGFAIILFAIYSRPYQQKSMRFLPIVLAGILINVFVPNLTFFYLLFFSLFFFVIEIYWGKSGPITWLATLAFSPIFNYLSNIYTFPIRITISQLAGYILGFLNESVQVHGTQFIINNNQIFSVETVCMGLGMVSYSLLICSFLMIYYQKKQNTVLKSWHVISICTLAFFLNIICNLKRILLIVIFKLEPSSLLHDVIGLICLLIIVFVPLLFIVPYFQKKFGKVIKVRNGQFNNPSLVINIIVLLVFSLFFYQKKISKKLDLPNEKNLNITRIEFSDAVVFKKPLPHFYSTEHSPFNCWRGEGYQLISMEKILYKNQNIYIGKLKKQHQNIYAAWWFSDGKNCTIDQKIWRWKMLTENQKYHLVNVNSSTELGLNKYIKKYYGLL